MGTRYYPLEDAQANMGITSLLDIWLKFPDVKTWDLNSHRISFFPQIRALHGMQQLCQGRSPWHRLLELLNHHSTGKTEGKGVIGKTSWNRTKLITWKTKGSSLGQSITIPWLLCGYPIAGHTYCRFRNPLMFCCQVPFQTVLIIRGYPAKTHLCCMALGKP